MAARPDPDAELATRLDAALAEQLARTELDDATAALVAARPLSRSTAHDAVQATHSVEFRVGNVGFSISGVVNLNASDVNMQHGLALGNFASLVHDVYNPGNALFNVLKSS